MRRLTEGGAGRFARDVLRSARDDAPSRAARERTAAALGVAATLTAGTATATTGAAGAGAATSTVAKGVATVGVTSIPGLGVPLVAKVAALALVAGTLVTGTVVLRSASTPNHESTRAPSAMLPKESATALPPPSAIPALAASTGEAPALPSPTPTAPSTTAKVIAALPVPRPGAQPEAPQVSAKATGGQGLAEAMALLEGARTALAAGEADRALSMVSDYERQFPGGALSPEASVLRIEALAASGRGAQALAEADRFLAASPSSPHARHVRAIASSLRSETNR